MAREKDGIEQARYLYFNSYIKSISTYLNIRPYVIDTINQYKESLTQANLGSDWIFEKIESITVKSNIYKTALGKSYIKLNDVLFNKTCIVNPKNYDDDKCFDWCLLIQKFYDSKELMKCKDKNEL